MPVPKPRDENGFALFMVLVILMAVAVVSLGSVMLMGSSRIIAGYEAKQSVLEATANAGLEEGRALLNAYPAYYPDSLYTTIENRVAVKDAAGAVVPGIFRSTYVGPTAKVGGEDGVNASLITVAEDAGGKKMIRRAVLSQESFAKYAYFTNSEGSNIYFGGGDVLTGPVHSNDQIKIHATGARFAGPGSVTTAKTVLNPGYGTFEEGYTEQVQRIELPTLADLQRLKARALEGQTAFTEQPGNGAPDNNSARLRIEFVTIDIDSDGQIEAGEGAFKVYSAKQADWVMARPQSGVSSGAQQMNANRPVYCGAYTGTTFVTARESATVAQQLQNGTGRCLLGGSDSLSTSAAARAYEQSQNVQGRWQLRPYPWANMPAAVAARADKDVLFPLNEASPNFKGVIYVDGSVAVSGVLRGRVTIAATGGIYIVDDLTYANAPGSSANCGNADMLGLFAGGNILVSDNFLNSPSTPTAGGSNYYFYGNPRAPGVTMDAVVLTLNSFSAENYNKGATSTISCGSTPWGRGCLNLGGGIIQGTRAAVAQASGTGYLKRYQYDVCAGRKPPPYFPTTGRFTKGRFFEMDPVGFEIGRAFRSLVTN